MKELLTKIKEWWSPLALREKQAISIGIGLFVLFIVYQWIWSPYLEHMAMMREQITADQKTLSWMRSADDVIQKIEDQTQGKNKTISPVELLSQIQKQINQAGLEQFLTQLKQASNESVEIQFQKIEFDKLVKLLIKLIKEQHISVSHLSLLAGNSPGFVNAEMIITLK